MSFIKSWGPIKPCSSPFLFRSSSTRRGTPHPGTRFTLPAPSQKQDARFPTRPGKPQRHEDMEKATAYGGTTSIRNEAAGLAVPGISSLITTGTR